jgi:hypothetical protein
VAVVSIFVTSEQILNFNAGEQAPKVKEFTQKTLTKSLNAKII